MVFAINAPITGNTFDAYRANAMGAATTGGATTGMPAAAYRGSSVTPWAALGAVLLGSMTML